MTLSTFMIALTVMFLLAMFIRLFWPIIVAIFLIIQVLFYVGVASLVSAVIWMAFIMDEKEGWGLCWLFFFITYLTIVGILAGIANDIFSAIGYKAKRFFSK